MATFREYIKKNYPDFKKRAKVKNLSITGMDLEGKLDFTGLGFDNLEVIDCWGNRFTGIDLDALNANKLTFFDIGGNRRSFDVDLSYFSRFSNLNTFVLHNNPGAVGNLESLRDLNKLEYFKIYNTNIEGDIENLPISIKGIECDGSKVDNPIGPNNPLGSTYNYGVDVIGNKLLDCKKQRLITKLDLTGEEKIKIESATKNNFEEILAELIIKVNDKNKVIEIQPLTVVNAQEWLDKNYPQENRNGVYKIYLNEPSLEGELDLGNFACWNFKVYISPQVDETKLVIKNKPKHVKIIKLVQAQECIKQKYQTKEEKEKEIKIDIHYKLEGSLDLSCFVNLEELNCSYNKLISLNFSNCCQLEKIYCPNNSLTHITLPTNLTN